MEFLSSAITPSDHQTSPSHVVGSDSRGLPVLQNMNDFSVNSIAAVSMASGASVNGNIVSQLAAFSNGIVSPDTSSVVASNPSVSQMQGNYQIIQIKIYLPNVLSAKKLPKTFCKQYVFF